MQRALPWAMQRTLLLLMEASMEASMEVKGVGSSFVFQITYVLLELQGEADFVSRRLRHES